MNKQPTHVREQDESTDYQYALYRIKRTLETIVNTKGQESTIVAIPPAGDSENSDAGHYGGYDIPSMLGVREIMQETPLSEGFAQSNSKSAPQTPKAVNSSAFPRTTIPFCYYSQATCVSATQNCTGHGQCYLKYTDKVSEDEKADECWTCGCHSTVEQRGKGNKTTVWGGPACQKKDISVPFYLFAVFGVGMTAMIAWGIGQLYSIGEEGLPSVLGAGVAPSVRK